MKKTLIILMTLAFASIAFAQSVEVKDGVGNTLLKVDDQGNVGILSVDGLTVKDTGVKFGTTGSTFFEIREITGTTNSTGSGEYFSLPSGFNHNNTRILSLEIQLGSSDNWVAIGYIQGGETVHAFLSHTSSSIGIGYPDHSSFHSRPWRAIIMRMP